MKLFTKKQGVQSAKKNVNALTAEELTQIKGGTDFGGMVIERPR
jgi:hypothetical protein